MILSLDDLDESFEGAVLQKASCGGNRSEAGRYAANMRWQGNVKDESSGGSSGALAEALQPTFDAEVAKATGRPWAPLLYENLPSEVKEAYEKYHAAWMAFYRKDYDLQKAPWESDWLKASQKEYQKLLNGKLRQKLENTVLDYAIKLAEGDGGVQGTIERGLFQRLEFQIRQDGDFLIYSQDDEKGFKSFDPKQLVDGKNLRVVVHAPSSAIESILSDGQVKSQHETSSSLGNLDPSLRRQAETRMFSQHPSTDDSMRPIYGSVMEDGVNGQTFAKSSQYGDVGLVLKKDVNARTTFTSRDSLAVGTQPSPISQPNKSSYFPPNIGRAYTEAQIHGQVKLSDIAYIVTDSSKISSELQQNLKKAGVPIIDAKDFYGYKWQVEETGDMTKAMRRLIAVRGSEQKLFHTHNEVLEMPRLTMRMGFIENEYGKRFEVDVDSALRYGYWVEADATVSKSLIDLLKASFGGDRSAAGRYAANQRWKGHAKDATKPATRERRMAEKFQEGPILKNGYDNFGFPRLLTSDEAKKQFGDTVTMQVAYFASRGVKLTVNDQTSDKLPRFDTESPAYFAVLQALDDVLDQVDDTKLNSALPSKSGLFPEVMINDYYENSRDTTGGYFLASSNDVALFMNTPQLIEKAYTDGKPFTVLTVPQLTADAIQGGLFGKDSVSARIAYGFTVHEMGHWIDYSLGNQWDGPPKGFWSKTLTDKVSKDPAKASDAEMSFALDYTTNMTDTGVRGSQYSNTAPVERFAENFTAWFTLTKVNELRTNELKQTLAARGGTLAVEAALEVLKQDAIVDNVLNWRPDHPVFLFAFYGEPFDVDALKKQSLLDLLKASFGGDRSAAGRYAANQRWKGQGDKKPEGVKSLKSAIVDALPMAMKLKSKPWGAGDESHYEMMVEMGHSKKSAKLATSGSITLADYGDPAVAAGNCGIASVDVGGFLIREGLAKEGEVFMREVGEPANGGEGGTHFVTHIGPKDSEDAIIVDFTLRQFDADADFPWVGTVKEYRETGYETDEVMGPEMGDESFDKILASGEVVYPWNEPGFKGDTDSK